MVTKRQRFAVRCETSSAVTPAYARAFLPPTWWAIVDCELVASSTSTPYFPSEAA